MDSSQSIVNFSILFVTLISATSIYSFPNGAPNSVCESMTPGHGVAPQNSSSPYDIILDVTSLERGQSMEITLRGKNRVPFKGYLIEARAEGGKIIGKFSEDDDVKGRIIDCGEGEENAVTHSNSNDKNEVNVTWTAPKNFKGVVVIYVTVVKTYNTFWVKEKSTPVTIT